MTDSWIIIKAIGPFLCKFIRLIHYISNLNLKTPFMKTLKSISLSLIFIFTFYGLSYSQNQIRATLKCNVAALQADNPPYQVCQFVDQEPGTDTRDYTIYAEVGDTIIWDGQSSDGNAAINITKIKYDRGTNVFNNREIDGETTVVGTVQNNTEGNPYKYKISFKINDTRRTYTIDPKVIVGGQ